MSMKHKIQKMIQWIRDHTPLSLRIKIGPVIAYIVYFCRVYMFGNHHTPKVLPLNETLDLIIKENLSVIRFGDGEMSLIENIDLAFQNKNKELSMRLKKILPLDIPGLLICVPGIFGKLNTFVKKSFRFTLHHLFKHMHQWTDLLSSTQIYGDAFITRPYLTYNNIGRQKSGDIFRKLFLIWENQDIVVIEGSKSRLGVGNDLFAGAKSIKRILCPAENAFEKYEAIKEESMKLGKDRLILVSLGPTAKVLAYDLFLAGYHVIDIGHIDMEYEMFLRNSHTLVKVPYKYFNEIGERNPEDCNDHLYLSQIIAKIE